MKNSTGTVEEINNYYPSGALFTIPVPDVQDYKYSGKELVDYANLGWYDYGARYYDPVLMRWHSADPLLEKYYDTSPYSFCSNNFVNFVDPDGKAWETAWDILNVLYDVGAATYHHIKGDHEKARNKWKDAGYDALAVVVPGFPAGFSKLRYADEAADAIGSLNKSVNAAENAGNVARKTTKNPYGAKGKSDHQNKVQELSNKANSEAQAGERVEVEKKIKVEGSNRHPDVQIIGTDGKTRKIYEAERHPGSKRNRLREEEYKRLNIEFETYPLQ